jgi:hypothetical protein
MEVDPESGDIYYWNKVTGITQFHEPEMLEVEIEEDDGKDEMPSAQMYSYKDLETAGWEVLFTADGTEYYMNPETGEETQFWPFEALYEGENALPRPWVDTGDKEVTQNDSVEEQLIIPNAAPGEFMSEEIGIHVENNTDEALRNAGWEMYWLPTEDRGGANDTEGQQNEQEQEGFIYYFHNQSGTQSWNYPEL